MKRSDRGGGGGAAGGGGRGDDGWKVGPVDGIVVGDLVLGTNLSAAALALGNTEPGALEDNVEVDTVDTGGHVVLETEINVLVDTEAEVASVGEVLAAELIGVHLEATLEEVLGTVATDGAVAGDLLTTTDGEGTHGELGAGLNGGLLAEIGEHLNGLGELVTALANGDVQNELVDLDLLHGVDSSVGHGSYNKNKVRA